MRIMIIMGEEKRSMGMNDLIAVLVDCVLFSVLWFER